MTVYIDGLLFLNFFFDFLLLLTTDIILKRNVKLFRIILGAFVGSLSILVLFFNINSFYLFIVKFLLGFLICFICFGFKNVKYFLVNFFSFYIVSIILGGFLYYLNLEFSYKHKGLIFYHKGISINVIFLVIFTPIILYIYIKQIKMFKNKGVNLYKVNIYIGKEILNLNGYLDTGNTLFFKGRPVIITNIDNRFRNKKFLVPYNTVDGVNLLSCIKVRKVEVIGLGEFKNVYMGFKNVSVLGVDVLLNGMMGGYND
ncbi:MAG: sigma-E processing peptidase SpoIIGA [Bacilli bacterium]|nr:sigma-E processing peptidase SpoIIGA [Bacilli bacterium]